MTQNPFEPEKELIEPVERTSYGPSAKPIEPQVLSILKASDDDDDADAFTMVTDVTDDGYHALAVELTIFSSVAKFTRAIVSSSGPKREKAIFTVKSALQRAEKLINELSSKNA